MKTIKFKPLRKVKKTGKIVVASYSQWRKIKTADYYDFELIINEDFKNFNDNELVHNHKGENLFWLHYNPEEIPTVNHLQVIYDENEYPKMWRTVYGMYSCKGLDVDGVPTFTNLTLNELGKYKGSIIDYEPLTVKDVKYWFGWFIYNLDNAQLNFED